jgi:hypothetical protein
MLDRSNLGLWCLPFHIRQSRQSWEHDGRWWMICIPEMVPVGQQPSTGIAWGWSPTLWLPHSYYLSFSRQKWGSGITNGYWPEKNIILTSSHPCMMINKQNLPIASNCPIHQQEAPLRNLAWYMKTRSTIFLSGSYPALLLFIDNL